MEVMKDVDEDEPYVVTEAIGFSYYLRKEKIGKLKVRHLQQIRTHC